MGSPLRLNEIPDLADARMVLSFSGWMDGGEISTGVFEYLSKALKCRRLGDIEPQRFQVYGVPGPLEIAALFRPTALIEDGRLRVFEEPASVFHVCEQERLVLFSGREPHLHWREFATYILDVARVCHVTAIYFVGSIAGLIPHTRHPRFFGYVSNDALIPVLHRHGLEPTNYAGPASFVTYLTGICADEGIDMVNLLVEVPAYIQGRNHKCLEEATRKLATVLGLGLRLDDLRALTLEFERRISTIVQERPEFAEVLRKMEHDFDRQAVSSQREELREWFDKQDIRFDL